MTKEKTSSVNLAVKLQIEENNRKSVRSQKFQFCLVCLLYKNITRKEWKKRTGSEVSVCDKGKDWLMKNWRSWVVIFREKVTSPLFNQFLAESKN